MPPLVVAEVENSASEKQKGEIRRRKKKTRNLEATPWDDESIEVETSRGASAKMGWRWAVAGVLATGLLLWVCYPLFKNNRPSSQVGLPDITNEISPEMSEIMGASHPEATAETSEEPQLWYDEDKVKGLCKKFLSTASVDELLPLIRDADRVQANVRRYYKDREVYNGEMTNLVFVADALSGNNKAVALNVQTKSSYRPLRIYVCDTEEGLKVDWESWVGHSEMTWEEIMSEKPTEPIMIRTMVFNTEYYNRDFADEKAWSAFRLLSPDSENVLYGYIRREDEKMIRQLGYHAAANEFENRMTLMIRFPDNTSASNQVIVDGILASDWLLFDTKQ